MTRSDARKRPHDAAGDGTVEETWRPVFGERPRTAMDSGLVGDDTPVSTIVGWEKVRRTCGPWEVVSMTDEEAAGVAALMAATKGDR